MIVTICDRRGEPAHAWRATPFVREALPDEAAVVDRLTRFPILVAMRERTAFPRSTLQRLPNLRLLVTTGSGRGHRCVPARRSHSGAERLMQAARWAPISGG
jgi:hypothetical protein